MPALPADPRYPAEAQYDLVVRGTSIANFARDGDMIRCVDLSAYGPPQERDLVIVRRVSPDGLHETTAKRLRLRGKAWELLPDSNDPRWQEPVRLLDGKPKGREASGVRVEITAVVLFAYRLPGRR
jgi:hypothetical protein